MSYYKDADFDNVLHGDFVRHIECPGCEHFYPYDIFHGDLCEPCALEKMNESLKYE